ncbi:MAG: hypothetical protein ACK2T7_08160 [Anaerolineales bacterium]|jgi:hypothetical protein
MLKGKGIILGFVLCMLLTVGCGQNSADSVNINEVVQPDTTNTDTPLEAPTITPAPTWTLPPVEDLTTQPPVGDEAKAAWVLSNEAAGHLEEVITVRVEVSYCSYKSSVNGSPTFCNDQPFPNHSFTYLIWGEDLSHLDGQCVLVSGRIVEYDGKPQIVLENEDQVTPCDG